MGGILWITIWAELDDNAIFYARFIKKLAKMLALLNKNAYICIVYTKRYG